jgi:hypothetical protein
MFILKHGLFILNDQIYHIKRLGLCYEILIKKQCLMELCVGNYETTYGLVIGADGIFEDFTKTILIQVACSDEIQHFQT